MSAGLYVIAPDGSGLPDVREPISSMACADGNLLMATHQVGFETLDLIRDKDQALQAIHKVIDELALGDGGTFDDAWCVETDEKWSGGREMADHISHYRQVFEFYRRDGICKTEKEFWARHVREELRAQAVRFYLYLKAGYELYWTH